MLGTIIKSTNMNKEECINRLENIAPILEDEYSVNYIGLFGSYARNEIKDKSDVDILLSFSKVPSLFTLIDIEKRLWSVFKCQVDISMRNSIDKDFYEQIKHDIIEINLT